jgi:hypothetical protein
MQLLVEFEHQQVRRGDAVIEQGLGEYAGAATEFDDAPGVPRQLRHHLPGQLLAGRRDRGNPQRVFQPLPKKVQVPGGRLVSSFTLIVRAYCLRTGFARVNRPGAQ